MFGTTRLRVDERERARAEERVEAAQVRELRADVEVADADVRLGEERGVLRHLRRTSPVLTMPRFWIVDESMTDSGWGESNPFAERASR